MAHRTLRSVLPCAAVLSACAKSSIDAPPPPGLSLELPFEDSCDPRIATGIPREVPAAGISFVDGIEGRAAKFDGSGAELKFKGMDTLAIRDSMTLEFFANAADWINPYGAGSGLESMVSHSDIFTVAVDPRSWTLRARITTKSAEKSQVLEGGKMAPGSWHHVALVYDGAQRRAQLVLDGTVVAWTQAEGVVSVQPNLDLVIGTWFARNQAFCGALDSIRLWNRALSAEELRARAAEVRGAATPSSSVPKG